MAQFLLQNHFQIVKVIRSGLRLPWVELKWYFITYRRFKWGQPECFDLKFWLSKILNSRIIPEKAWKSGFFPVHSQYKKKKKKIQNNSQNSKNSRTTVHPEPPDPLHNKSKFEIFQPSFWYWGRGRGGHCKWWNQHK